MKYTVEIQKDIAKNNPEIEIIYFWGHTPNPKKLTKSCFSQWYDCKMEVDGVKYHTSEQYMMAQKAFIFKDIEVLQEILNATDPKDYKELGRKIRNFDSKVWDEKKYDVVLKGNIAKFTQNPELKEFLLSTGDALIAEASPYDAIWGIKLGIEPAKAGTPEQWKGQNLLGCVLMDVRDRLRGE